MYQNHSENDKINLEKLSTLVEDFTKIGMEILNSTIDSKEILKTDLAPILLYRQTLEMSDAIGPTIRVGCVNASKPLVRTLLEAYFQLAYLFNSDEERKGLQFLYHYEKRKKDYY
jgi:hypothetical protein